MIMYNIRLDLTKDPKDYSAAVYPFVSPRKAVARKSLTSVRNWKSCSCSGSEPSRCPAERAKGERKGVIIL